MAIADLWNSERGLIAVLLIIGATVLAALGKMPFADWKDYTLYIFGIYATTKTVTGVTQIWKSAKSPSETVTATPDKVTVTTTGTPSTPGEGG